MQKNFFSKGKIILIKNLISLYLLFFSNLAFAMMDESIELVESPSHTPRVIQLNTSHDIESSSLDSTETGEDIKKRLARAISKTCREQQEAPPPHYSFREVPPILGVVSGIPLSEFAIRKAGDSLFLQIYFEGSTIVSVGLTRVWALDALFNEIWRSQTKKASTHVIVNGLSMLSTLPLTYAVWKNTNNIPYTLITFMSEWSLSTLGFYEISNKFRLTSLHTNANQEGSDRQHLLSALENLGLPSRHFFRYLLSKPNLDTYAHQLLSSIDVENSSDTNQTLPSSSILTEVPRSSLKTASKAAFYVFPMATLIVNLTLANQSIDEFTSNLAIKIPYILLTTTPSFALQLYTTSSSVDDLWGDTINNRSYFRAKNRILFYLTGGLSLLASFGSAFWGVGIVDSAFKGSFLENLVPFFMFTTASQIIIFESHCIRDYFGKKYFHYKDVKGTEEEKSTTKLVNALGKIDKESTTTQANNYSWYNPIGWYRRVMFIVKVRKAIKGKFF